ncbi:MAG TPA: SsgA family sporulation/cell division regulator [Micromonosporaceae bacterium]|nr:SsgA family sporulation/cell division regulator [Micromonosporaceae bacterium]
MNARVATIEHRITGAFLDKDLNPTGKTTQATFMYCKFEPFAIRLVFPAEAMVGSIPGIWVGARCVLGAGLVEPSGLGDMQVFPLEGRLSATAIRLVTEKGDAVLRYPTREVQRFLDATYDMVPAGAEPTYLDVDGVVERLLSDAR